jgi:two-component system chemotaxis response regulator CheY
VQGFFWTNGAGAARRSVRQAGQTLPEISPMAQILVVDDSSTVRDEVAGFLKRNGLDVATAVDGNDGLSKLRMDPKLKLVVSDVNMPNMDGLTMAEKIRGELGNKTVNIIMLTTENSPIMKERGKAAGIKGWIVKPFKGDAVLATFKKLVEA